MDLIELVRKRRSVRRFRRDPIPEEDLKYILDFAHYAPSGANRQPWRFVIVKDPELKREIRRICEDIEREYYKHVPKWFMEFAKSRNIDWRKPHLEEAPVLIHVFGYRRSPHWKESVWLMIGYLLIAAALKGYATLTYTPSDTRWANKFFDVPENWGLETIINIGYPAQEPSFPGRYELNEICYLEKWGIPYFK